MGASYPAHRPHSQIDHILVRDDMTVLSGEVLAETPSDHRPIRARLRLEAVPDPGKRVVSANLALMTESVARAPRRAHERVVQPRSSVLERFRRIVTYHELLVGMTRKELKVKYKNSILGSRGRC